jgi:hypothetical protein
MRIVGQSIGAAFFRAVVNLGLAAYGGHLAHVTDGLMNPTIRASLPRHQLDLLTLTLAFAIRNIYIIGAIVGIIMLALGRRLAAERVAH